MGQKQSGIHDFYKLKEKLGRGSFAVVRRARRRSDGRVFAIKVIYKKKLNEAALLSLREEVAIMAKIDHPNVVHFYEVFESPRKLHLVMELLTGGELFERIIARKSFSEKQASNVIKQVTMAIAYLHSIGITHRDLKPENLIYATPEEDSPIKVIDFGLANYRRSFSHSMGTPCGTPGYVAPEVIKGEAYGPQVDLWSIGVILYVLLCGYPPFYSKNLKKMYKKIMNGEYDFPDPHWTNVSQSAKDLIKGLLTVDPAERFTTQQVLEHPWIAGTIASGKPQHGTSQRLRILRARRKLKRTVATVIAINKISELIKEEAPLLSSLSTQTTVVGPCDEEGGPKLCDLRCGDILKGELTQSGTLQHTDSSQPPYLEPDTGESFDLQFSGRSYRGSISSSQGSTSTRSSGEMKYSLRDSPSSNGMSPAVSPTPSPRALPPTVRKLSLPPCEHLTPPRQSPKSRSSERDKTPASRRTLSDEFYSKPSGETTTSRGIFPSRTTPDRIGSLLVLA